MCACALVSPTTGSPGPPQTTPMTQISANRAHRQASCFGLWRRTDSRVDDAHTFGAATLDEPTSHEGLAGRRTLTTTREVGRSFDE